LLHNILFAFGGIPLIYMGDELGLLNDYSYVSHEALAGDNRWLHRPHMDWEKAQGRHKSGTVMGRIYDGIRHLVDLRRRMPALHAQAGSYPVWTHNEHVFGLLRSSPRGRVLILANFSDRPQPVSRSRLEELGFVGSLTDKISEAELEGWPVVMLGPYDAAWLEVLPAYETGRHARYD
jgi:amylosucrase